MKISITLDDIQVRFLKNDLDMSPNDDYAISGSIDRPFRKERTVTKSATYCDAIVATTPVRNVCILAGHIEKEYRMLANWYKSELRIIQDDNSPMEIMKAVISILEGYPGSDIGNARTLMVSQDTWLGFLVEADKVLATVGWCVHCI